MIIKKNLNEKKAFTLKSLKYTKSECKKSLKKGIYDKEEKKKSIFENSSVQRGEGDGVILPPPDHMIFQYFFE